MAQRDGEEHRMFVAAAARLKAEGHKQKTIAVHLRRSEGEVARLLQQARASGWLEETLAFRLKDPGLWRLAEQRFFSPSKVVKTLRDRFGPGGRRLNRVTLIHPPEGEIDTQSAEAVRDLLGDAGLVGVAWGRTLAQLAEAMAPARRKRAMRFVPLCGEPMVSESDPSQHSSSALAVRLHERMGDGSLEDPPPSIAGVPSVIPQSFRKREEVRTIRRFISMVRGYEDVFGPADGAVPTHAPLVGRLDAILTSVGVVATDHRGVFVKERVQLGDIAEDVLLRAVAGDVGGVLIARADASPADRQLVTALNAAWTGVTLENITRCAAMAAQMGFVRERPGVVLLALGAQRAEVVLRCVELGLVNELVMDPAMEDALERMLAGAPGTHRPRVGEGRAFGLSSDEAEPPRRRRGGKTPA